MGKLYGVSVGAGDPQLMTLKAVQIIRECSVIAVPRTSGSNTLALSIAESVCDLSVKRIIYVDFPMSRDENVLNANYDKAAKQLCAELGSNDAAMLALGDISVYSTFSYIAERVRRLGFDVEICPGVTSFSAAAALLGKPLCLGRKPLHIIPYDCEELEEMLELSGTKVIMKAGKNSVELIELLRRKGLVEHTSVAVNCGLPDERLYRSCGEVSNETGYFTVFIISDGE
ncbi:MAG: precorrin-2 C(20)-methyltransferase [Ruminococcus sp.]|uniref:precorrin-2 C(20)-methyltransferase n=1 Tax=Ruminococcus sp. TaxID=41978 RepID=UPI0025CC6DD4|nr:precorrin-2 C(20)-methyltransferase [Ruminococcus sp.]MCR5600905.1 precorrin-2 C(20)-methyltransferase [Ruminococcus sp.]